MAPLFYIPPKDLSLMGIENAPSDDSCSRGRAKWARVSSRKLGAMQCDYFLQARKLSCAMAGPMH